MEVEQLLVALSRSSLRKRAAPDLISAGLLQLRRGAAAMSAHPLSGAARREVPAAVRIPYAAHVSPHVVTTTFGDYLQVFRLGGASFECADDETLNTWHERLNVLWRNVASPQVALWAHVI